MIGDNYCPRCSCGYYQIVEQPRKYKKKKRRNKLVYRYWWCSGCGYVENLEAIRR